MRARRTLAVFLIFLADGVTAADGPLSAIDWLSDSVAAPPEAAAAPEPGGDVATSALPGDIEVAPLDAPRGDAVGILPPEISGLPADLWGPARVGDVIAHLEALPNDLLPALRDLLVRILLAELRPPADSLPDDRLLLARTDKLLALGAIEQAGALLDAAGPGTPERFRRYFDIALLTGRENAACDMLRSEPEISPTYPARIFCLARGGDWPAAAVTLETAEALGILTPQEDSLLAQFLDPDIVDELGLPPPRLPSPLQFRIYEAIGEPIPTGSLPLAYAHADLRDNRGWKARIEAGERLARAGALGAEALTALYLERRPSASGGLWDRAAAVQRLDRALAEGDRAALAAALADAWARMSETGLQVPFARAFGPRLVSAPSAPETAVLVFEIGLLSKDYRTVAANLRPIDPRDRFLAAIAQGRPAAVPATEMRGQAIRQGFAAVAPPDRLSMLLAEKRTGEAILRAIELFSEGANGDPDGLADAIALFRGLGLVRTAERAALELLILKDPA